jgi:hypothetical protein
MQARSISMNWKQARRTENSVDRSTVMYTKAICVVEQSLKEKPTHAHSLLDADGVQNETAERNEAFRRAILAIPAGKGSTYGARPQRLEIRGITGPSAGFTTAITKIGCLASSVGSRRNDQGLRGFCQRTMCPPKLGGVTFRAGRADRGRVHRTRSQPGSSREPTISLTPSRKRM